LSAELELTVIRRQQRIETISADFICGLQVNAKLERERKESLMGKKGRKEGGSE